MPCRKLAPATSGTEPTPAGLTKRRHRRPRVLGRTQPTTRTAGDAIQALLLRLLPWAGLIAVTTLWARDRRSRPPGGLSKDQVAAPEHFEAEEPGRGRLAPAPVRIPMTGWRDIVWRTWLEVNQDKLPSVA